MQHYFIIENIFRLLLLFYFNMLTMDHCTVVRLKREGGDKTVSIHRIELKLGIFLNIVSE